MSANIVESLYVAILISDQEKGPAKHIDRAVVTSVPEL